MQVKTIPLQATLPTAQSTNSFWHQDPARALIGHRTTAHLPQTARVVIVGSGITGAFAAREVLQTAAPRGAGNGPVDVLMLEAREACWGATGRNGGHCQPLLYASPPSIARFELDTYRYLDSFIRENQIECDWKVTNGGVHPLPTQELVDLAEKRLRALERSDPDLAALCTLVKDEDGLRRLRLRGDAVQEEVKGAIVQQCAAKCWPYKLVAWVLGDLLQRHGQERDGAGENAATFNLQTNTPVTQIQHTTAPTSDITSGVGSGSGSYVLHTPRGQIVTSKVLLATNGYTSRLLPLLTGSIVPVRGQVCALRTPAIMGSATLAHSYGLRSSDTGSEDYLIQRDTGPLIFGGERLAAKGMEIGISDDAQISEEVGQKLRTVLPRQLNLSGRVHGHSEVDGDARQPGELHAEFEWTGIMGYARDGNPWVGQVPVDCGGDGRGGLWVAAGYTGHGMPVAARCGIAVAERMMETKPQGERVLLPSEYEAREGRRMTGSPEYMTLNETESMRNAFVSLLS